MAVQPSDQRLNGASLFHDGKPDHSALSMGQFLESLSPMPSTTGLLLAVFRKLGKPVAHQCS
ncbi:MAG: hypothetical protein ACI8UD_003391 [Planctomycetota bacterium]|jgi:hypothetical protein